MWNLEKEKSSKTDAGVEMRKDPSMAVWPEGSEGPELRLRSLGGKACY